MNGQPVFAALSDPTRRLVLQRLSDEGPTTATNLAADLPISRQAVAKHLAILGEAGLVERRTVGRETRFEASLDPLGDVASWIAEVGSAWDDRLARLRDTLS